MTRMRSRTSPPSSVLCLQRGGMRGGKPGSVDRQHFEDGRGDDADDAIERHEEALMKVAQQEELSMGLGGGQVIVLHACPGSCSSFATVNGSDTGEV